VHQETTLLKLLWFFPKKPVLVPPLSRSGEGVRGRGDWLISKRSSSEVTPAISRVSLRTLMIWVGVGSINLHQQNVCALEVLCSKSVWSFFALATYIMQLATAIAAAHSFTSAKSTLAIVRRWQQPSHPPNLCHFGTHERATRRPKLSIRRQ